MASDKEPSAPSGHDVRRSAGWDIASGPRNYTSLLLTHGATALLSFTTVWVINRSAGAEGYGGFIAFVAASQFVQVFLNWSATGLTRFGIEEFVETGRITGAFWSRTLIFLPNLLIALAASPLWLGTLTGAFRLPPDVSWLVLVHILATSLWLHTQYALQSVKMMRLQGVLLVVERVLVLSLTLVLASRSALTPSGILWCFILPPAVMTVVGLIITAKYIRGGFGADRARLGTMMRYSLPLIPFAIIGYLSTNQLDAYFLNKYMSTADLGIYSVASQANGMALQIPILANGLLISLFISLQSAGDDATIRNFFRNVLPTLALVWNAACLVTAFAGVLIIPLVFGDRFLPAQAPLFLLLCVSACSAPVMFGYAAFSHAISATYISSVAAAAAGLVNVILDFILIPRMGLAGCALASLAATLVLNVITVVLVLRASRVRLSWAPASILPSVAGATVFLVSSRLDWSFVAGMIMTAIVTFLFRGSVKLAVTTLLRRGLRA